MLKYVKIILTALLFVSAAAARPSEDDYKLVFPKLIPVNNQFDISLVTANKYPGADRLQIFIAPDPGIVISEIRLRSSASDMPLGFLKSKLQNYNGDAFSSVINLNDSSLSPGSFFQMLFTFRNESESGSVVRFYGVYKQGDKILGYLSDPGDAFALNDKFIKARLKFYKPQKNAGKAVQLERNSKLSFQLDKIVGNKMLAEFWLRINDPGQEIFSLQNLVTGETEFTLSVNDFQMLLAETKNGEHLFTAPYFMGRKTWSHISVVFASDKNTVSFYCSGNLFGKIKLNSLLSAGSYEFIFEGDGSGKRRSIDLLRFISLGNSIEVSFLNKNYNDFLADSSFIIASFRFDDQILPLTEFDGCRLKCTSVQHIKSSAPIFARAPELNIGVLGSSYKLSWTGGDYKQAVEYILERSSGSQSFSTIYSTQADNSAEKEYEYIDANDPNSEIIYYRVKQINRDGSVVFSSQVKIGAGESEPLVLAQNFPNPFNPETYIEVEMLKDLDAEVVIYNLEGQEIATLFKGRLSKGIHKFKFDGSMLPSGIYLYKITTPGFYSTRKMVLTK